jgi:hypothetical protein
LSVCGGFYNACSTRVNGGVSACASTVRIARGVVEDLLLADLRESPGDPTVVKEVHARLRKHPRSKSPAVRPAQVAKMEQEIATD